MTSNASKSGGCFEEATGLIEGSKQGVDLVAEVVVTAAGAIKVRGAIRRGSDLDGLVEDRFHALLFASQGAGLRRRTFDPKGNATCGNELCHDIRFFSRSHESPVGLNGLWGRIREALPPFLNPRSKEKTISTSKTAQKTLKDISTGIWAVAWFVMPFFTFSTLHFLIWFPLFGAMAGAFLGCIGGALHVRLKSRNKKTTAVDDL